LGRGGAEGGSLSNPTSSPESRNKEDDDWSWYDVDGEHNKGSLSSNSIFWSGSLTHSIIGGADGVWKSHWLLP